MRVHSSENAEAKSRSAKRDNGGTGNVFARAVALARKGRYADASNALQAALAAGECSEVEALDLQARIYAQQGLYFYAESCWTRAQQIGGPNPEYEQALARLRQARFPRTRLCQISVLLAAAAVLFFALWQTLLVNPSAENRQVSNALTLAAVKDDLAAFRTSGQERDQQLAASIADLKSSVTNLDVRLSDSLHTLPTAAGVAEDRAAVIARLDEQALALQNTTQTELGKLEARLNQSDAAIVEKISAIEGAVSEVTTSVNSLEEFLTSRFENSEAGVVGRLEQAGNSIQRDLKSLSTAAEVAALAESIAGLRRQIFDITAAIAELKMSSGQTGDVAIGDEEDSATEARP